MGREHVSSSTVCSFAYGLTSATSATVAGDKLGRVQELLSRRVASWGAYLPQYFARFLYAITVQLSTQSHLGISNAIRVPHASTLRYYKYSHILNHLCHSQKITKDRQTSGHSGPLECCSTGRDNILRANICLSIGTLFLLVSCPGR
jgi:hypothetical protein